MKNSYLLFYQAAFEADFMIWSQEPHLLKVDGRHRYARDYEHKNIKHWKIKKKPELNTNRIIHL